MSQFATLIWIHSSSGRKGSPEATCQAQYWKTEKRMRQCHPPKREEENHHIHEVTMAFQDALRGHSMVCRCEVSLDSLLLTTPLNHCSCSVNQLSRQRSALFRLPPFILRELPILAHLFVLILNLIRFSQFVVGCWLEVVCGLLLSPLPIHPSRPRNHLHTSLYCF